MRTLLAALILAASVCAQPASAQTALPDSPGWTRLEAVDPDTKLYVKTQAGSVTCHFKSAGDGALTCTGDGGKLIDLQRPEIRKVRAPHRLRSTLVGLGIGAVGGIIFGAAIGDSCTPQSFFCISRGSLAAAGAVLFGGIGAIVGVSTDFTRSTIYKAP